MKKKEAKVIALKIMMTHIGTAYYRIYDGIEHEEYNEEEKEIILQQLNLYGERIAKFLKTEYITY